MLGDSELVVHQVKEISVAKHLHMRSYHHKIWDLIESFEAFNIQKITQKENEVVDCMETIGSLFDPTTQLLENEHSVWVFVRPVVPDNDIH